MTEVEQIPYILFDAGGIGTVRDRRVNCLAHILNTAIDRGDLTPEDAYEVYENVVDNGHIDHTPLPPDCNVDDPWLGTRDPCQDLDKRPG